MSESSLIADIILDGVNARIKADSVLLHHDLLLNQRVDLLLQEVALIDIVCLQLLEVLFQVGNVVDDLLQNVIRSLCCVVLQRGTLTAQELHLFLIVIEKLHGFFAVSLSWSKTLSGLVGG